MALNPGIKIIAPWKMTGSSSPGTDLIDYAQKHGIPIPVTSKKPYSRDRNLLHISFEGGILEDPWKEPTEDMFLLTRSPEKAPDQARYVEIDFERGPGGRETGR